jgi:hypothetical protein
MNWFMNLWNKFRMEMRYRKRLKELRKRDPFIYK